MKEVKKASVKKAAPKASKAVATKKPAAKKPAARAAPKAAVAAKKAALSPEQRYKMTEEAAYYIAERHGFYGDSQYFWSLAVEEIDAKLK